MRVYPVSIVFGALLLAAKAHAAQIQVSEAWIRALPSHLPAAGYFTLRNPGTAAVALTGAETPACSMLMLHKSSETGGMGSMEDVASVTVPPGGTVTFAPGGYHLMCMDPTPAIKPGAGVAVTLRFSDGSATTATFAVKNAQGK